MRFGRFLAPDVLTRQFMEPRMTIKAEPTADSPPEDSAAQVAESNSVPAPVGATAAGAAALGAFALGALALGVLAVGALAIGRLAIGRAAVGRVRLGRVVIDELVLRRMIRPD